MKRLVFALVLLLFFPAGRIAFAQHNNIRFDHLTLTNGLSQSSINCMLQDRTGFIWLGTQDGLNKYDGYRFKVFKNEPDNPESISNNFVHALGQDSSGRVWVGTEIGLNILDPGEEKFRKCNYSSNAELNKSQINSLFIDGNVLWLATPAAGVLQIDISGEPKLARQFLVGKTGKPNNVNIVYRDKMNTVWAGTENGLYRLQAGSSSFEHVSRIGPNGLMGINIRAIMMDSRKHLWIGSEQGLEKIIFSGETVRHYIHQNHNSFSPTSNNITSLFEDHSGTIWIGTDGGGLLEYVRSKDAFLHYESSPYLGTGLTSNKIYTIIQDNSFNLWIGTEVGVNKFDRIKKNFSHFFHLPNDPNSLSSNMVWCFYKESDRWLWVGNDLGLNRIDRENETTQLYSIAGKKTGNPRFNVSYICKDAAGVMWLATDDGLCRFDPGRQQIVPYQGKNAELLKGISVYFLSEDKHGNLWMGTKNGLFILEKDRKNLIHHVSGRNVEGELPGNNIRCIVHDNYGTTWLGSNGSGLIQVIPEPSDPFNVAKIKFRNFVPTAGNPASINNNIVLAMVADAGGLWLGTFGGGLNRYDFLKGKFSHITEKNGLSNNTIYGIVKDEHGNLWISTNKGVSCYNHKSKKFQNYYENDGLQSNEFNTGAYHKGADGEIFFGGINGFNAFYPSRIRRNPVPPKIVITDFQVFNKSVVPGPKSILKNNITKTQKISLSYKNNFFSFEFSALHFSSPEKNQYKYRMVGLDEEWNYSGTRRTAYYTNLEPDDYIFQVTACNADGIWSDKITEINITITPPFWKTWWFRIVSLLAIIAGFIGYNRWKIKKVESENKMLEELVHLRTLTIEQKNQEIELHLSEIEKEKEKVEQLLLNILPPDTVKELKTKGKAQPRQYRLATVMFTDFKGFTRISETLSPKELVEELDRYFIKFDEIIEKYGLEKIKTIGDAYMCAGGLPIRNKSNPIDVVLAGLDIQAYMRRVDEAKRARGETPWELRIGIHSGELIAGVVGIKRFAYDIWGDTVNIANRMESSSETGKVNVSGFTYDLIKEFFDCTYRGKVLAKNKGEIDMYFVERIKEELSLNGEGIKPNEHFYTRLDYVLYSKIQYKHAETHIVKLLGDQLSDDLHYHGLHHTLDVCRAAEEIALAEGIEGEDMFVLKTAALFHDAGFVEQYHANEPIGMRMAREILPQYGFNEKHIDIIDRLIMSTQIPQTPTNHLEEIMCDADLDYLGRDDFHQIADSLFRELKAHGKIKTRRQWDEIQIPFLEKHRYFTHTNIQRRQPKKLKHISEIKARLERNDYGEDE